jgi:lipopolysaccharide biosynthesis glycosyltransferase
MFHLFINFKPDNTKAYGGGNITTYYIQKYFNNKYNNFKITYELKNPINLYLIIDPFKDNKFKKYSLEEVINHRNTYNKHGKIIIRVNDCDITRPNLPPERSREKAIIKNNHEINYYIFNSEFIRNHYKKFLNTENSIIIYNGCDTAIFYPKLFLKPKKYRIITHHWSDNMNKGYQMYYDLWNILKNTENYEFIFIGKNVPEMFKNVPIIGPYIGLELSNTIRDCHIYITDSIYDSCPNHVIEAISCGLPILYRRHEGGSKELCELFPKKIGASYASLEELIEKLVMIRKNYEEYKANIEEYSKYFELNKQISKYDSTFLNVLFQKKIKIGEIHKNDSYTLCLKISTEIDNVYIKIGEQFIRIISGKIYHINAVFDKQTIYLYTNTEKKKIIIDIFDCKQFSNKDKYRLINDKLNILYCSDKAYFTPMFASLYSVLENSGRKLENIHFNFIVPIGDENNFQNMILEYNNKREKFEYSIILIDKFILDNEILNSKCYDGGNHLLNLGNFFRLMIGEIFSYPKLLYLDSDSICKMDINLLEKIDITNKIYCLKANKKNNDNKRSLVLKMGALINEDYCLKKNINLEEFAYYGAPIFTDCRIWVDIYSRIIKIIKEHNKAENGIYKLFTMSLQNILFYGKMEDIYPIIKTLPDLGSKRKEWTREDIDNAQILDWSGVYKPWFNNGLYKEEWEKYNIIPFLEEPGEVEFTKKTVEKFII